MPFIFPIPVGVSIIAWVPKPRLNNPEARLLTTPSTLKVPSKQSYRTYLIFILPFICPLLSSKLKLCWPLLTVLLVCAMIQLSLLSLTHLHLAVLRLKHTIISILNVVFYKINTINHFLWSSFLSLVVFFHRNETFFFQTLIHLSIQLDISKYYIFFF